MAKEVLLIDRLRALARARFDLLVRHPATDAVIAGLENVSEKEAGHFMKRYLDRGYTVHVRNRRTGRIAVELPATEVGEHARTRLMEEIKSDHDEGS
jgi:hypothetical protein